MRRDDPALGLEVFSEQQLRETCLRLEGRVRMLRCFLADLHCENATLRRQRAVLSERLGELEDSCAAVSGDAGGEDREARPLQAMQAPEAQELELRRCQAQEEQLRMEVCEHQLSRAQMEQDSAERLQRLTAREELELRRCQAQEEQLRMEVCEHQLSRAQMEQELELRRCQAQEEQLRMEVCEHQLSRAQMEQDSAERLQRLTAREEFERLRRQAQDELQMEAGMVQPSDVRGFSKGAYANARAHDTPVSSEKILLGPPAHASAHASAPPSGVAVAFTWAASPGSGQADAPSERSERSDSHASRPSRPSPSRLLPVSHSSSPSSVTSFPLAHSHIPLQRKVLPAGEALQRPTGLGRVTCDRSVQRPLPRASSVELQLPPPPRSSPARDVSELHPADLKLTVLTSDSRWETLMFRSGDFEKQALEFLREKKLKAAFVGGLAAKMKAMVAAGQAQSSVDIVDLI